MKKILIADDHAIVRRGLMQVLTDGMSGLEIDQAEDGHQAVDKVRKGDFDLLLLDISMPGKNGVDVLKQVKQLKPELPVLILSMYAPEQYALRLLRAGASGYLNKEAAPELLVKAVSVVAAGKKFITPEVAELMAEKLGDKQGALEDGERHTLLSDRELHVFLALAVGQSLTDIGQQLSLSVKTIASYRSRILQKMQMKTNAEMTLYASKYHLIS